MWWGLASGYRSNILLSKSKVVLVTLAERAVLSCCRSAETSETSETSISSKSSKSTISSESSEAAWKASPEIVLIALTEQRVLYLCCRLGGDQRAGDCEEQEESGSHHLVDLLG